MTGWSELEATFGGAPLAVALISLGFAVGMLTGMFGIGGGTLIAPLLISVFKLDPSLAVGTSLCVTLGTAAAGFARHRRMGNIEPRAVVILGLSAAVAMLAGRWLHFRVRGALDDSGDRDFEIVVQALFALLLTPTAWSLFRTPRPLTERGSMLQRFRLPPHIDLPHAGIKGVSFSGMALVGVHIGLAGGFLGIGGGIFLMPLLILMVGLRPQLAVGCSLGAMLISSIVGTTAYAAGGHVNLWVAMILLVGSTGGIQLGAWLCHRLDPARLRRYFGLLIVIMIAHLIIECFSAAVAGEGAPPTAINIGRVEHVASTDRSTAWGSPAYRGDARGRRGALGGRLFVVRPRLEVRGHQLRRRERPRRPMGGAVDERNDASQRPSARDRRRFGGRPPLRAIPRDLRRLHPVSDAGRHRGRRRRRRMEADGRKRLGLVRWRRL
jgi:hypothetical protein